MPATRSRRIVRRAVMAAAGFVVLMGVALTRPSAIQRSRAVMIGMTRSEVENVLGPADVIITRPPGQTGLLFGRSGSLDQIMQQAHRLVGTPHVYDIPGDWPVHVWLNDTGCVCQIKRGDVIEDAPQP